MLLVTGINRWIRVACCGALIGSLPAFVLAQDGASGSQSSESSGQTQDEGTQSDSEDRSQDQSQQRERAQNRQAGDDSDRRNRETQRRQDGQQVGRGASTRDSGQFGQDGDGEDQAGLGVTISQSGDGIRIEHVYRGSPAQQAGLRQGDVILEVDGQSVRSTPQLIRIIRNQEPGSETEIVFQRNGRERSATVTLESLEEALPQGQFFGRQFGRWPGQQQDWFDGQFRRGQVSHRELAQYIRTLEQDIRDLTREVRELQRMVERDPDRDAYDDDDDERMSRRDD